MHCKHPWDMDFLHTCIPKTFLTKEWVKHREDVIWEREQSMMPATQQVLERERLREKQINMVTAARKAASETKAELQLQYSRVEPGPVKKELYKQLVQAREDFRQAKQAWWDLWYNYNHTPLDIEEASSATSATYVRQCPCNTCRGFVCGKTWKCGMCEAQICKSCEEVKEEGHTCDPQVIETVRMIKKDSKPCPKCCAKIYKIDGCNQMYCIQCHTAFDWISGKIETGHIHNPEYYRWIREHNNGVVPREAGDRPGGANCDQIYTVYDIYYVLGPNHPRHRKVLDDIHQWMLHLRAISPEPERYMTNEELRRQYLLMQIDEKTFKIMAQRREKKMRKEQAYRFIIQLVVSVVNDAFFTLATSRDYKAFCNSIKQVVEYGLEQLREINKRLDSRDIRWHKSISQLKIILEENERLEQEAAAAKAQRRAYALKAKASPPK